jgi:hypothetical protein
MSHPSTPQLLAAVRPNQGLLEVMVRIAVIQRDMNPKHGKDTLDYLREAREGAMYGDDLK